MGYFLQDHLGSTVGLADAAGAVVEQNSYDSFGNPSNPNFSTRYQFTGREFDRFAGLQYSRARWYHPGIGRFISEDPIGFAGGEINLYGYVKNNPLSWKDPWGLDLFGAVGGGSMWGGAVIGGGASGSYQVGYGSDGLGSSASYGYFYGPGHTPADTRNHSGWAVGGGAGIGGGVFWSNADTWCQLAGDSESTILGFGPLGAVQIDVGGNNVWTVQVYPGPLGKGPSYGITHFRSHTPATGRFSDALDDARRKLREGIRTNYCY